VSEEHQRLTASLRLLLFPNVVEQKTGDDESFKSCFSLFFAGGIGFVMSCKLSLIDTCLNEDFLLFVTLFCFAIFAYYSKEFLEKKRVRR
jgi:hypothetical protein